MSGEVQNTIKTMQPGVTTEFADCCKIFTANKEDLLISEACQVFFTKHLITVYGRGSSSNFHVSLIPGDTRIVNQFEESAKTIQKLGINPLKMISSHASAEGYGAGIIKKVKLALFII